MTGDGQGVFLGPVHPGRGKDTCWCGAPVGPRVPGDADGLGCLDDIWHVWDGVGDEPLAARDRA